MDHKDTAGPSHSVAIAFDAPKASRGMCFQNLPLAVCAVKDRDQECNKDEEASHADQCSGRPPICAGDRAAFSFSRLSTSRRDSSLSLSSQVYGWNIRLVVANPPSAAPYSQTAASSDGSPPAKPLVVGMLHQPSTCLQQPLLQADRRPILDLLGQLLEFLVPGG